MTAYGLRAPVGKTGRGRPKELRPREGRVFGWKSPYSGGLEMSHQETDGVLQTTGVSVVLSRADHKETGLA